MTARIAPQDEPSNTKVSTFEPSHLGEGKSGTCDSSRSSRRLPNIYCCSKGTELEHHQMGLLAELGIGSCSHYAAPQRRSDVHPHSRNRCNGSELYARSTFEPKSCKQTPSGRACRWLAEISRPRLPFHRWRNNTSGASQRPGGIVPLLQRNRNLASDGSVELRILAEPAKENAFAG